MRSLVLKHPLVATALLLAAMLLRLAVPAGFMPVAQADGVSLVICSGVAPVTAHAGMHHADEGKAATQRACAYADLSLLAIGGADPVQIAAAPVFITVVALFLGAALPPRAALRLRPPLRGPPLSP